MTVAEVQVELAKVVAGGHVNPDTPVWLAINLDDDEGTTDPYPLYRVSFGEMEGELCAMLEADE